MLLFAALIKHCEAQDEPVVCVCVFYRFSVCVCVFYRFSVCVSVCVFAEKLKVSQLCVLLFAEVKQCEAQL